MKTVHLECMPDECLVKTLGFPNRYVEHHNDKGRVCIHLEHNKNELGMVDEDPDSAQPSYLKTLAIKGVEKHHIRVLYDSKRKNTLVVICPRLEEWILYVCRSNGVDITHYKLKDKPTQLHREITQKLPEFKNLLTHLSEEKKAPQLLYLQDLLKS